MMIQAPSPNHNARKLPVSLLVLHYTGMESGAAALERLTDPSAEVSAHYLVEEDGRIFQLVEESERAWHAGVGEWQGITDVNSASIGIEIVNGGHDYPNEDGSLPEFPDVQVNALIPLCKQIITRHGIKPSGVVGHSDIAPARKDDPGEAFPWKGLAAAGIGLWPDVEETDPRVLFEPGDRDRGVALMQRALAGIGYGVEIAGVMDDRTVAVVRAFQRRFRPSAVSGVVDMDTLARITRLAQMV